MRNRSANQSGPIVTRWNVITGAPSSGKTTVIEGLAARGFHVKHEVARAYIDQRLARGESLERIKSDPLAFERHILLAKVDIEKQLPPAETIFLDRAIPDSIAYFELEGLDTAEPRELSRLWHYRRVFLFEPLPFEKDQVRWEDRNQASQLEGLLDHAYTGLGYDVIRIPVMPIIERIDFIIECINPDITEPGIE
jgi:predicted ATPase